MKKFSQLEEVNEEFLSFFRSKDDTDIGGDWMKCSMQLIKMYCQNLFSDEHLHLAPQEKEMFDFETYKVKSIKREDRDRWIVRLETFDSIRKPLGEKVFKLEVK